MASIKDLFTRDENNVPVRVSVGDEWVEYLGTDSDVFRAEKRKAQQEAFSGSLKVDDMEYRLVAALITGWSFDEPCETANKVELLKNTPSLCEQLDRMATARANFTKPRSSGFTPMQDDGSGSAAQSTQKPKSPSAEQSTTKD